nr:hypothetical protein GCM10020241_27360 [Streptoalloteichus tenebrarius]
MPALESRLLIGWQLEIDIDVMAAESPLDPLTPDVVVFSVDGPLTTRPIKGANVLLVVEVVSKGAWREVRGSKPIAYAEAGTRTSGGSRVRRAGRSASACTPSNSTRTVAGAGPPGSTRTVSSPRRRSRRTPT